jgi:hypothetical protein
MNFYNEEINSKFNSDLQQQIDGTLPLNHVYQLGKASEILQSAGIPKLEIELDSKRLRRKSQQENHPFDLADMKNLPEAVQKPLAVFDSTTKDGSFVILTEIQQQEKNYVAVLQGNRKNENIQINSIRSVYPKESASAIAGWINSGLMKYADKNKMGDWLSVREPNYHSRQNPITLSKTVLQQFTNNNIANCVA